MLASTIQFSNTPRQPRTHPDTEPHPHHTRPPGTNPGDQTRPRAGGMSAGADPRPKKRPTPTPPHRGGSPTRRPHTAKPTGHGGTRGSGLSPQDPTVRHPPHPGRAGPPASTGTGPPRGAGTSTMFPPTSTHPAARSAARGWSWTPPAPTTGRRGRKAP